jgi:predicted TIM-barrel fold metal-dependent hydrolase
VTYDGPVVDVDIHHRPTNDAKLLEYVPERSRAYADALVRDRISFRVVRSSGGLVDYGGRLATSYPPDGGASGSSYELLRDQNLDEYNVYRGLLTYDVGEFGSYPNHYFAADLCRASNDWNIAEWLGLDERLYSGIVVSPSLPDEAAHEIARLADHPRMVYVAFAGNPLQRPLGDPLYHPIYAAASEAGLPVGIHVASAEYPTINGPCGTKATLIERLSEMGVQVAHYVTSLITHGVFEKFPKLKVLFLEYGVSWLPSVLWSLEHDYELLRLESPWVKRRPTEYVQNHIRFSTQPLEMGRPTDGERLVQLLETVDGIEDMLCFSTDYPHFSMDDFVFASRVLPSSWHRKVFCENACDFFGWAAPAARPARREARIGV